MASRSKETNDCETSIQRTVILDIPPRLQWENGHGYCGETAIQSFGIYIISLFDFLIFISL